MTRTFWNLLLASPIVLGVLSVSSAIAATPSETVTTANSQTKELKLTSEVRLAEANSEITNSVESQDVALDQVTSVSQLSDVQPTDWAFQALQSLVERYGVIAGYPDGTFRGNRALTRYEFAAGLNAALDRVNELIAAGTADLVTKEDLAVLQRLQEEFAAELATLRGRVDALEARTAELEANQFSTTTKLNGEAIFALVGVATGQGPQTQEPPFYDANFGREIPRVTAFGTRVRLNFDTSFTGEDLLRTRLQFVNLDSFYNSSTFTPEGDLRFAATPLGTGSSNVVVDALLYSFPIGDRTRVTLEANAGASDDFASTVNPFIDGDGGSGALTQFGTRNPIYYYMSGIGLGVQHEFNDNLELSLGYLAPSGADPTPGNGLFNGAYGAIAQLLIKPTEQFNIGLTYINAYNIDTGAGSTRSNLFLATGGFPVVTNSYGIQASFQVSPNFVINGWGGYTTARIIGAGDATIWNYAVALAFPDLGKKGNLAGIIVGVEPQLTYVDNSVTTITGVNRDRNTSIHVEGFFTYQVSDNIAITPGVIWLTAPNHDERNSDAVIGVVRTTFFF